MEELKRINASIAKKQIFRIGGAILAIGFGLVEIAKFMYQKGVTDCQANLHDLFPEEYESMTAKLVKLFEEA